MDKTQLTRCTRKSVIKAVLQPTESRKINTRSIAHRITRGVLWAVMEETRKTDSIKTRYLSCSLLFRSKNGWSSMTFTESSFSNIYNCPVEFLEMVPDAINPGWRRLVHNYHALMASLAPRWVA